MKNLLWLGDPKSFDVALVGGKAANLSRLARIYHRVPDERRSYEQVKPSDYRNC